jgi:translation elongation factor EF-Tu-like GTPase
MPGAKVYVQFVDAKAGGRDVSYIKEPYRPHFRVGDGEYLGIEFFDGPNESIPPGVGVNAKVRFSYTPNVNYDALKVGVQFQILEGHRIVGVGSVTELLP